MKTEWQNLYEYIEKFHNPSPAWRSDQKSLLEIIKWSDDHDIKHQEKGDYEISKIRTIIKSAKKAISANDVERVTQLFEWVATLTLIELRHNVGISPVETIEYDEEVNGEDHWYTLRLRSDQLERIQALTKSRYHFIVEPQKGNNP